MASSVRAIGLVGVTDAAKAEAWVRSVAGQNGVTLSDAEWDQLFTYFDRAWTAVLTNLKIRFDAGHPVQRVGSQHGSARRYGQDAYGGLPDIIGLYAGHLSLISRALVGYVE